MVPKNKITDLFDTTLSEETSVNAWRNNELTFLSVGYVRICLPNKVFNELCEVLANFHRMRQDNNLAR